LDEKYSMRFATRANGADRPRCLRPSSVHALPRWKLQADESERRIYLPLNFFGAARAVGSSGGLRRLWQPEN
jgi:hypothetical protein